MIKKVLQVFKLRTGGLNPTEVQLQYYTPEVHLSTILIHFILSSLSLCNCNVIKKVLQVFKLCTGGLNQTKVQLDKVYSIRDT